jgi:hypothetical protein
VAGVAAVLVIAAVLAVTGLKPRHDTRVPGSGVPGTAALTPSAPTGATGPVDPPGFVLCVPSTGACSVRIVSINGVAWRMTQNRL